MTIPCDCCPLMVERCVRLAAPAFFAPLDGVGRAAGPGASQFTWTNFAGSGVTVQVAMVGGETFAPGSQGSQVNIMAIGPSPPRIAHLSFAFSQPIYLRRVGITDLDFPGLDEQAGNFNPQRNGVYGQKLNQVCGPTFIEATPLLNPLQCVKDTVTNGTGGVTFAGPQTSTLDFDISRSASGAGSFLTELGFDVASPHDVIMLYECPDGPTWFDTAGNAVDPNNYEDC